MRCIATFLATLSCLILVSPAAAPVPQAAPEQAQRIRTATTETLNQSEAEGAFPSARDWSDVEGAIRKLRDLGEARVAASGVVRPGDLPPGNGIEIILDLDWPTTPSIPLDRAHIWIMEPAYEPVKWRKPGEAASSLWAAYAGHWGPCRVFWRPDPLLWERGHYEWLASRVETACWIGVAQTSLGSPALDERLSERLSGSDPEARRRAMDEYYLLTARHSILHFFQSESVKTRARAAFRRATASDDPALRRYIRSLYTEGDMLIALPHIQYRWNGRDADKLYHNVLMETLADRPDLTDMIYRHLLAIPRDKWQWPKGTFRHFLPLLPPPSPETLRVVLRTKPPKGFEISLFDDVRRAAVYHVAQADLPGFVYELAPFAGYREEGTDDGTREIALDYLRRHRDAAFAPALIRAINDQPAILGNVPGNLLGRWPQSASDSGGWTFTWRVSEGGLSQWIESGYPWRQYLEWVCSAPPSEDLSAALLEFLEKNRDYRPRWRHGTDRVMVPLSYLVRYPVREALPYLLTMLDSGPDSPAPCIPARKESAFIFRRLVCNEYNLPCIAAAQAIIRLGPEVSRAVLDHAVRQFERKGDKQERQPDDVQTSMRPSDIELCLFIVGLLANANVRDDFIRFGERLRGTAYEKDWTIANQWFEQGGKTFRLPRPPLPSVASRATAEPASRTLTLSQWIGSVLYRDWDATGTSSWEYLQKGDVLTSSQARLKISRVRPTTLQKWLQKNGPRIGIPYKINYRALPPDLGPLRSLGPSDVQALDLSNLAVGDGDLAEVRRLAGLFELNLSGTQVAGRGLGHLAPLPSLEMLDLSRTPLTDSGVAHLKGLKTLHVLDLGETPITDGAVAPLTGMTWLRVLVINDTEISREGFVDLSAALSQCEIWR